MPNRRRKIPRPAPASGKVAPLFAARLVAGLFAAGLIAGGWLTAGPALGQGFPRLLEDLRIFGKGESVQFVFSQPYDGLPTEEHRPGVTTLTFLGVGSTKPLRTFVPRDESVYKEIRVEQNKYSTTVTFLLRDATQSLRDQISYAHDRNTLTAQVGSGSGRSAGAAPPGAGARREPDRLLPELEQKIAGPTSPVTNAAQTSAAQPAAAPGTPAPETAPTLTGPASAGTAPLLAPDKRAPAAPGAAAPVLGGLKEENFFSTLATMVIGLALMLGLLYGILYVYKRYVQGRFVRFAGSPSVRQVAAFAIGPRQRIVILEINGELIACGVTPSQITFLTRLSGQGAAQRHAAAPEAEPAPQAAQADTLLAQQGTPAPATGPDKPDPVHQFAEVLKQKVRSLKRIN